MELDTITSRIEASQLNSPNPAPLRVSHSALQDWRTCPHRYWYRYVDGLRPKLETAPPTLGRLLHRYLETYYSGLAALKPLEAHKEALGAVVAEYTQECEQLAWTANSIGEEELAKELSEIVPLATILIRAYFRVRGKADAARYETVAVEKRIELPVADGIVLPGVIDLITKDRETGHVQLWEHKTTRNVPRAGRRFRDLQTLLYVVAADMQYGIRVDEIVWNYIRTYPPKRPEPLKNGQLSRDKRVVTTVDLYHQAIADAGLDAADYEDMISQVKEREQTEMFPRFELPIVQSEDVLLRDYVLTALEVQHAVTTPDYCPIRNVSANCDWCPFVKLCEGVLLGGDDLALRRRLFKEKKEDMNGKKYLNKGEPIPALDEDFAALLE